MFAEVARLVPPESLALPLLKQVSPRSVVSLSEAVPVLSRRVGDLSAMRNANGSDLENLLR